MEHERFFYFGNDVQAAKWYLLTGSSATPQRMLCRKDYARSKNIVNFGSFVKMDRARNPQTYCYVIVNIFDIPFNELQNFFVMACENNTNIGSMRNPAVFDINFKKDFVSGRGKSIPNININTTTEELTDNYLSGLEDITPNFQWNLSMNTVPCNAPRIPRPINMNTVPTNPPTDGAMDVDSDSQGSSEMRRTDTGSVKRRGGTNQDESTNKVEILSNEIFGRPNEDLFQSRDNLSDDFGDFPSIAPSSVSSSTINLATPEVTPVESNVASLSNSIPVLELSKLSELGLIVKTSPRSDWFNVEYTEQVMIVNEKLYFASKSIDSEPRDNLSNIVYYPLHPEVIEVIRGSSEKFFMRYPTFVTGASDKRHLINTLTTEMGATTLFDNFASANADVLVRIVESANDQEFIENIRDRPIFGLLFGLYKYMKMRRVSYTLFMEIMATIYYGSNEFSLISELFIKAYMKVKGCKPTATSNATNLYHLQRMTMQDVDVTAVQNLIDTFGLVDITRIVNNLNAFTFDVGEENKIPRTSNFCLNLFAIDQNQQYIFTPDNKAYLSSKSLRNSSTSPNLDQTYRTRYANDSFNVFSNVEYRGLASY